MRLHYITCDHIVQRRAETVYFSLSVSDAYLAATVNTAAVAKHHGVRAFINMSQMTVSQMSITETTASPQHKLQWLSEQALNWSTLPVVHVRPTVFLEGFFLTLTSDSVRQSNQIRLPFGEGKTSPVAAQDVARVVATLLENPQPHIGKIYHLTGPQSENLHFYAQEYSKALGRAITFQDIPVEPLANQEQPEIDPRRQPGPAHGGGVERRALRFGEVVESIRAQQLIQSSVERVTRRRRQIRRGDPHRWLPLALSFAHRHSAL